MRRLFTRTIVASVASLALVTAFIFTGHVRTLHAQGYSTTTAITKAVTLTASSYSSAARYMASTVTLTPTSTITITGSNSVAATSGEIILSAGKTIQDGFYYGTRGKFTGTTGTFNQTSAGRITGIIGQSNLGTMTLTSGQVSGVWADLQGGPTNTAHETYPLRVSNSMSINADALALLIGHADFAFAVSDLGNGSSGDFVINASGTSAGQCAQTGGVVFTKTLKIQADGTTYYIGLCTAP